MYLYYRFSNKYEKIELKILRYNKRDCLPFLQIVVRNPTCATPTRTQPVVLIKLASGCIVPRFVQSYDLEYQVIAFKVSSVFAALHRIYFLLIDKCRYLSRYIYQCIMYRGSRVFFQMVTAPESLYITLTFWRPVTQVFLVQAPVTTALIIQCLIFCTVSACFLSEYVPKRS